MEFEDLEILEDELEVVEKNFLKLNFPAVHVGKHVMYFNVIAKKVVPEWIEWHTTPDYIVGLPTDAKNKNSYHSRLSNRCNGLLTTFPSKLKTEKALQCGVYKIYRYKDGFAFKRYEKIK